MKRGKILNRVVRGFIILEIIIVLMGTFAVAVQIKGGFSLGYQAEAVYTNHPQFNDKEATEVSLPQYAPTVHSQMIYMPQFHASRYAAVGVMPTFTIIDNLIVRLGMHAMWRDTQYDNEQWQFMGDLSVVYRSFVGPLSLTLSKYGVRNSNNFYLSFNFGYLIFAPKGTYY